VTCLRENGRGDLKEIDKLVDLNVDGKIIFNWIVWQLYVRVGLLECSSSYVHSNAHKVIAGFFLSPDPKVT
jgi:hypothetical protein